VNIIAGKPVRRVEVGYALAQFALLPLQPFGFGLTRCEVGQKLLYESRYGCVALRSYHARPTVCLVVK